MEREQTALRRHALLPHLRSTNADLGSRGPDKEPAPLTELALDVGIEEVRNPELDVD